MTKVNVTTAWFAPNDSAVGEFATVAAEWGHRALGGVVAQEQKSSARRLRTKKIFGEWAASTDLMRTALSDYLRAAQAYYEKTDIMSTKKQTLLTKTRKTHPPSVLNKLLTVYFVQPRYSYIIPLCGNEPAPELIVFPSHGLKHGFGTRIRWVRSPHKVLMANSTIALLLLLLLLGKPESSQLPAQPVHMRLRFCLESIFQVDLFFAELRVGRREGGCIC